MNFSIFIDGNKFHCDDKEASTFNFKYIVSGVFPSDELVPLVKEIKEKGIDFNKTLDILENKDFSQIDYINESLGILINHGLKIFRSHKNNYYSFNIKAGVNAAFGEALNYVGHMNGEVDTFYFDQRLYKYALNQLDDEYNLYKVIYYGEKSTLGLISKIYNQILNIIIEYNNYQDEDLKPMYDAWHNGLKKLIFDPYEHVREASSEIVNAIMNNQDEEGNFDIDVEIDNDDDDMHVAEIVNNQYKDEEDE